MHPNLLVYVSIWNHVAQIFGHSLTLLLDPVTSDPTLTHWLWPLEGSHYSICSLPEFSGNAETSSDGTVSKDTASTLLLGGFGFGVMTFARSRIGWKEYKSGTERLVVFKEEKWELTRPRARGLFLPADAYTVGGGIFGTSESFSSILSFFSSPLPSCWRNSTPESGGQVLTSPPELQMVLSVVSNPSPDGTEPAVPALSSSSSSSSSSEKEGSGLTERVKRCSWAEVRRKAPLMKPVGDGEPRSRLKRARLWVLVTDSSRFSEISFRGWKCISSLGILGDLKCTNLLISTKLSTKYF